MGATMMPAPSSEGHGLRARRQDHNVNWLVPATNRYPIVAAPWVLRLNQGKAMPRATTSPGDVWA